MLTALIISVIVILVVLAIMGVPNEVLYVGLGASIFTWIITAAWDVFGNFMGWWTVIY